MVDWDTVCGMSGEWETDDMGFSASERMGDCEPRTKTEYQLNEHQSEEQRHTPMCEKCAYARLNECSDKDKEECTLFT